MIRASIHLILLLSCTSLFAIPSIQDSIKSNIYLHTYVENENVPLNREVVYHVELVWRGELNKYKIREIQEPSINNLSMRGSGSSNKVTTAQDGTIQSTKRISFYFRPLEIGMAYIDGVIIKYDDLELEQEESLISSRLGIKIIDPIPESTSGKKLSLFGILAALIVMVGLGFIYYMRYRKRKQEEQEKELKELTETIESKYLRLLKETVHFHSENLRDSLSDLSRLFSGYLSERYQISAMNLSAKDLIENLQNKNITEESLGRIKDFYEKANLVKFAAEEVNDSDFHRLYDTVEIVLENQKSIFPEEEVK